MSCAVEECHAPSLYGGLLLARQCSLEGAHLFPPYRQWVQVCLLPPPLSLPLSLSLLLSLPPPLSLPLSLSPSSLFPSLLLLLIFSAANVWGFQDYRGNFKTCSAVSTQMPLGGCSTRTTLCSQGGYALMLSLSVFSPSFSHRSLHSPFLRHT